MTDREAANTNDLPREDAQAVPSSPKQEDSASEIVPTSSSAIDKNVRSHGPDLLTLLLLAVFFINLGFYLNCQHSNLSRIAARDNLQVQNQKMRTAGPRDSRTTERERLRRGEAEQVLHAPTEGHESGITDELFKGSNAPESADDSNKSQGKQPAQTTLDENGIDQHWLASMMFSAEAKTALAELEKQSGELKLTDEQKEQVSRIYSVDYTKDFSQRIRDILSDLNPRQIAYVTPHKEELAQQGESFGDFDALIDDICAKLEQVKKADGAAAHNSSTDKGNWGPNQLVLAVNMLVDCQDESCQITESQAKLLVGHLHDLQKAAKEMNDSQAHIPLPSTVLNDEQILFLDKRIKELNKQRR